MKSTRVVFPSLMVGIGVLCGVVNPISAQTVPDEAVLAAKEFLDKSVSKAANDPNYGLVEWRSHVVTDVSEIYLGDPYSIYLMTVYQALDYAESPRDDPLAYAKHFSYAFPVFHGADYIGTIAVIHHDGQWRFWQRYFADNPFDPWLLRVREQDYPPSKGFTVSLLLTKGSLGHYMVIRRDKTPFRIAPATETAAGVLSLGNDGPPYPFVAFGEASASVKKAAKAMKQRFERTRQRFREE